jgi:FMN phosphatase YigB (HAD superfamily)
MTTPEHDVVFLLDVDNTLIDNDAVKVDMAAQLKALLGDELAEQFWDEYEEVRRLTSVVDLPLTFERFAPYVKDEATMAVVRAIIMDYPFASRVFPETMATLAYLRTLGTPVIVSDGDTTYQPRKIERSGLGEAVEWQVVIYVHKEEHLDEILARWPARYYVMVDDKARILAATKRRIPDRAVTVQVMQGHYAQATAQFAPPPDIVLESIGDVQRLTLADYEPRLKR